MPLVKAKYGLPVLLMVVFALTRWPGLMPDNFSAVYGLAFCAGVYLPSKAAWWLPLGTLVFSDIILNLCYYHAAFLDARLLANYSVYAALIWLGKKFTARASWLALLGGGIMGAILFYLVTNTLSWMLDAAYAKTLAGWIQALTIGTPGWPHTWEFFFNSLTSGGLFTGLFAGAMKLAGSGETEESEEEEGEKAPEPGEAEPEETPA